MYKIITIISGLMGAVLPIIISIYVGTIKIIQAKHKITIWILCFLMAVSAIITIIGRIKNEATLNELYKLQKEFQEIGEYNSQLLQRQILYNCEGLEIPYINNLGNDPIYKHHFNIGIQHYNNYKYAEGIDEFNKCLNVKTISLENKVTVNTFLGNCFSNINNTDKAEKYYKEAIIIAKNIKDQKTSKEEVANATVEIGNVYYINGDYKEALNYYNEGFEFFRNAKNMDKVAKILNNISNILDIQGKYKEAIDNYEEILSIFVSTGNQIGIARTYNGISGTYKEMGDYSKAMENCIKAIEILDKTESKHDLALAYGNKANILRCQEKYDEALNIAEETLFLFVLTNDKLNIANSYNTRGTIYYIKKEYNKALEEFQKSFELLQETNNIKSIENVIGNMGNVYKDIGKYDEALNKYQEALDIAEEINHVKGIFLANQNIGHLYYIQKEYEKALKYYLEVEKINDEYHFLNEHEKEKFSLRIGIIKKKISNNHTELNITYGKEETREQ